MAPSYAYPSHHHNAAAYDDASTSSDPFASPYETSYRGQQQNDFSSTTHRKQTPPEIQAMKARRKRRTVASGVAGGVFGLIVLGPVGGIIGGVGSAVVAKKVGKRNEKRKMDKLEAQQNPLKSSGRGEFL